MTPPDDREWTAVVIKSPLKITAKEMRWWFERNIKGPFSLRTTWSFCVDHDRAWLWDKMGWHARQQLFYDVIFYIDECNYTVRHQATFAFEKKADAMLFKLTFAGSL